MKAVECKNLSVGYGDKVVLSNINFELESGVLAVLIGANGSGKSTLLRTLAGLQLPLSGTVSLGGMDISKTSQRALAKTRAIVDTARHGGGALTVVEAVAVGRNKSLSLFGRMSKSDKEAVAAAIAAVGISDFADRYLANLSDGERQKVMIARAIAQDTPVIFLDEPTAFLDVAARIETMKMLGRLSSQGKTIILSTHDIAPAIARADRLIVVDRDRHSVAVGTRESMIESGALDAAFRRDNVHFDASILDYR